METIIIMGDGMEDTGLEVVAKWYELWYRESVSPSLDKKTKEKLAKKINALLLDKSQYKWYISKKEFPELEHLSNAPHFTRLQLYVILTEIACELGIPISSILKLGSKNQPK